MSNYSGKRGSIISFGTPTKDIINQNQKYDLNTGEEQGEIAGLPDVFKINDITLKIPPTNIGIHKEDMVWSWKTLRTKAATKVPSGQGVCHVTLTIVFTPELLLHLHRLIIQFQHSPFCWISNDYLKDSIVPHWSAFQQMAFTLSNMTVTSMSGSPGTFICELDLKWFNYFPYAVNFLYRDEWKTVPMQDGRQYTIPMYGREFKQLNPLSQAFPTRKKPKISYSNSMIGPEKGRIKKTANLITIKDVFEQRPLEAFDLSPKVDMMQRAAPVDDPAYSRIYVRYINSLQQEALWKNFGIDIAGEIEDNVGEQPKGEAPYLNRFTYGLFGGMGLVKGWHTGELPASVRSVVVGKMLEFAKRIVFTHNQYKTVKPTPELQDKINEWRSTRQGASISELMAGTAKDYQAYNAAIEAKDSKSIKLADYSASAEDRITKSGASKKSGQVDEDLQIKDSKGNEVKSLFIINPESTEARTGLVATLDILELQHEAAKKGNQDTSFFETEIPIALNAVNEFQEKIRTNAGGKHWIVDPKNLTQLPDTEVKTAPETQILHMKYYPPTIGAVFIIDPEIDKAPSAAAGAPGYPVTSDEAYITNVGAPIFSPEYAEVISVTRKGIAGAGVQCDTAEVKVKTQKHFITFYGIASIPRWIKKGAQVERGQILGYSAGAVKYEAEGQASSYADKPSFLMTATTTGGEPVSVFQIYTDTRTTATIRCGIKTLSEDWIEPGAIPGSYNGITFAQVPDGYKLTDFITKSSANSLVASGGIREPGQTENWIHWNIRVLAHQCVTLNKIIEAETGIKVKLLPTTRTGGSPFITSGTSNSDARKNKTSMHYYGRAIDISQRVFKGKVVKYKGTDYATVEGRSWVLYEIISRAIADGKILGGGLGLYKTFVHYDIRSRHQSKKDGVLKTWKGTAFGGGWARWAGESAGFATTQEFLQKKAALESGDFNAKSRNKGFSTKAEIFAEAEEAPEGSLDEDGTSSDGGPLKQKKPDLKFKDCGQWKLDLSKVKKPRHEAPKMSLPEGEKDGNLFQELTNAGWTPYERDTSVKNVWIRTVTTVFANTASNISYDGVVDPKDSDLGMATAKVSDSSLKAGILFKDSSVVTGVSASMTHAVASIPIIGQEFPTQQHLGSMEPSFNIQLTLLDWPTLNSLGQSGKAIESIRAMLQEYARSFRPIRDAWTLATDHFTTRLFGTYTEEDLTLDDKGNLDLRKRSCISALDVQTVEGSPGTSVMSLGILETNPAVEEELDGVITATPLTIDQRRTKIIKALYDQVAKSTSVKDKNQKKLLQMVERFGQVFVTAGEETDSPSSPMRLFSPRVVMSPKGDKLVVAGGEKYITPHASSKMFRDVPKGQTIAVFRANTMGADTEGARKAYLQINKNRPGSDERWLKSNKVKYKNLTEINTAKKVNEKDFQDYRRSAQENEPWRLAESDITGEHIGDNAIAVDMAEIQANIMSVYKSVDKKAVKSFYSEISKVRPGYGYNVAAFGGNTSELRGGATQEITSPVMIMVNITDLLEKHGTNLSHSRRGLTGELQINNAEAYEIALDSLLNFAETIMVEDKILEKSGITMDRELYGLMPGNQYTPSMYTRFNYWMFLFHMNVMTGQTWNDQHLATLFNQGKQNWTGSWVVGGRYENWNRPTKEQVKAIWSGVYGSSWNKTLSFVNSSVNLKPSARLAKIKIDQRWAEHDKGWEFVGDTASKGGFVTHIFSDIGGVVDSLVSPFGVDDSLGRDYAVREFLNNAKEEANNRVSHYLSNVVRGDLGLKQELLETHLNFLAPYIYSSDEEGKVIDWSSAASQKNFGLYPQLDLLFWSWFCPKFDAVGEQIADDQTEMRKRFPQFKGFEPIEKHIRGTRGFYQPGLQADNAPGWNPPLFGLKEWEERKIRYVRERLAVLADEIFGNPQWINTYGLQELYEGSGNINPYRSGDCYPDMNLPPHPFYRNETQASPPDFYMWNIYEDAGAQIRGKVLGLVEERASHFVNASWNFFKKLQGAGLTSKDDLFKYNNKNSVYEILDKQSLPGAMAISRLVHHPDGTDTLDALRHKDIHLKGTKDQTSGFSKFIGSHAITNDLPYIHDPEYKGTDKWNPWYNLGPVSFPFLDHTPGDPNEAIERKFHWPMMVSTRTGPKTRRSSTYTLRGPRAAVEQIANSPMFKDPKLMHDPALAPQKEKIIKNNQDIFNKSSAKINEIRDLKSVVPTLSATDFNIQYATNQRAYKNKYEEYQKIANRVSNIESMFGSHAGYTGQYFGGKGDAGKEAAKAYSDVAVGAISTATHSFDKESLARLTRDSARDILSQKLTMKRAYPTFKLFFVEEDENESRWLNFDDFYSFNGVKEFTVHNSRKSAATTATITLQNIAGTLDGTKRGAIVDMDYLVNGVNEKAGEKNPLKIKEKQQKAERTAAERPRESTGKERVAADKMPFQAVVLRQGMNVQLRAGYSNDPDSLEVLISGRLTDISWNKTGDLTEIVVQSFGTELVQQIKGGVKDQQNSDGEGFPTTHHLLGAMMLSPELKHFGRWETGNLFQIGESKDHRLDFHDYTRDNAWSFGWTSGFTTWCSQHVGLAMIGAVAFQAVMFIPMGRLAGLGLKAGATAAKGSLSIGSRILGGLTGGRMGTLGKWIVGGGGRMRASSAVATDAAAVAEGIAARVVGEGAAIEAGAVTSAVLEGVGMQAAAATGFKGWLARLFGRGTPNALSEAAEQQAGQLAGTLTQILTALNKAVAGKAGTETVAGSRSAIGRELGKLAKSIVGKGGGRNAFKGIMQNLGIEVTENMTINQLRVEIVKAIAMRNLQSILQMAQLSAHYNAYGYIAGQLALRQNAAVLTKEAMAAGTAALGGAGATAKGLVGLLWRAPGVVMRGGAVGAGVVLTAELIYEGMIEPLITQNIRQISNQYRKHKTYLKLHPADDNLYAPTPLAYMKLYEGWADILKDGVANVLNFGSSVIPIFGEDLGDKARDFYNIMTSDNLPAMFLDKRIDRQDANYSLGSKNIWEIFHEMSLRHPGWAYAARPYGENFEYRMFFGVPSQRYWSKPYSNAYIYRLNSIRSAFKGGKFSNGINKSLFIKLYGKAAYDEIEKNAEKNISIKTDLNSFDFGSSGSGIYKYVLGATKKQAARTVEKKLIIDQEMSSRALAEYCSALEDRFVPFRRYHLVSSERDIVKNGIISSEHNVTNAVNVIYRKKHSSATRASVKLKAASSIPEEMVRMETINYPNCVSYPAALRYGQGHMIHTMKEMYRGEVLLVGNARIRPWDICLLMDSYNDMAGPIEVEAVTHIFSHETGFLTEIKPNAVVVANEVSSWQVIEGLKVFAMAQMDCESGGFGRKILAGKDALLAKQADSFNDDLLSFTMGDWSSPEAQRAWLDRFNKRFPNMKRGQEMLNIFPGYQDNAFGKDHRTDGSNWGEVVGGTATVFTAMLAAATIGRLKKFGGALKAGKKASAAVNATVAMVTGTAAYHSGHVMVSDTPAQSVSWLVSGPLLLSKCMEEELIAVVPLLRNNRPIVAGLSLRDPMMSWQHQMGNISSTIVDTVVGTDKVFSDFFARGYEMWRYTKNYWNDDEYTVWSGRSN